MGDSITTDHVIIILNYIIILFKLNYKIFIIQRFLQQEKYLRIPQQQDIYKKEVLNQMISILMEVEEEMMKSWQEELLQIQELLIN